MWSDPTATDGSTDVTQPRPPEPPLQNTTYFPIPNNNPYTKNVQLSLQYDEPPHPLNRQDANGCFDLAFLRITDHDLNQPFPKNGAKIQAGNVILQIGKVTDAYTWGLFDYTIRQVQATQSSTRGWWSCAWGVVDLDEKGVVKKIYAVGRLYSPFGGEEGTGNVESA